MTAWLVSPLIIESSHRILIAAAACRFHLDYVNLLILLSYMTLLHNHNLKDISELDVITAFRLQPIYGYLYRNFNLDLFKLRVNDTMKKQLSS